MKCPECLKENKKSVIYVGACMSTLACSIPHYDKEGVYHNVDPNITTTSYWCSEGHKWIDRYQFGNKIT